jgi:hypothetical protein
VAMIAVDRTVAMSSAKPHSLVVVHGLVPEMVDNVGHLSCWVAQRRLESGMVSLGNLRMDFVCFRGYENELNLLVSILPSARHVGRF